VFIFTDMAAINSRLTMKVFTPRHLWLAYAYWDCRVGDEHGYYFGLHRKFDEQIGAE